MRPTPRIGSGRTTTGTWERSSACASAPTPRISRSRRRRAFWPPRAPGPWSPRRTGPSRGSCWSAPPAPWPPCSGSWASRRSGRGSSRISRAGSRNHGVTRLIALVGDANRGDLEEHGYRRPEDPLLLARRLEGAKTETGTSELGGRMIEPDLWERLEGTEQVKQISERRVILPPGDLFRCMPALPSAVAFVDEVEDLASTRRDERRVSRRVTNEFLRRIPSFRDSSHHLLVCATNQVGRLDPAFLRPGRFDHVLPVGPPDAAAREAIWRRYVGEITDEDVDVTR